VRNEAGGLVCFDTTFGSPYPEPPGWGPYLDVDVNNFLVCALDASGLATCWQEESRSPPIVVGRVP
jgi:hypothetical protein